ncbi:MAG: hypothetical protein WC476_11545 [Phycisphaerae bacterium]
MEQTSESTPGTSLSTYRDIIKRFLPFVLIRCTKYTNSKHLAETIAVYTFVSSYYLARMPENRAAMPIGIGCMTDVVGEDLGNGNTLNGLLLFEREDALYAAKALAGLDIEESIAMALYYVEKFDLGGMAAITGKSIDETVGIIGNAQRLFLENLERFRPRRMIVLEGEIRRSMACIIESFDRGQFERITESIMRYLRKLQSTFAV